MNRDRAVPGPGADGVQTVISRDRAVAGPVADAVQPVMSRDRAVPAPGVDGVQTVVGPDSGDMLDGGAAGEKRLFASAVAAARDAQVVENHSEPPPTNPVLAPPQQVDGTKLHGVPVGKACSCSRRCTTVTITLRSHRVGIIVARSCWIAWHTEQVKTVASNA